MSTHADGVLSQRRTWHWRRVHAGSGDLAVVARVAIVSGLVPVVVTAISRLRDDHTQPVVEEVGRSLPQPTPPASSNHLSILALAIPGFAAQPGDVRFPAVDDRAVTGIAS